MHTLPVRGVDRRSDWLTVNVEKKDNQLGQLRQQSSQTLVRHFLLERLHKRMRDSCNFAHSVYMCTCPTLHVNM